MTITSDPIIETMTTTLAEANVSPTDWVAVARHIADQLEPGVKEADLTGEFVHRAFDVVRETGLGSMLVPTEFGGGGGAHAEACAVVAEIGGVDPSTALTLSMHFHLVATQVWRHNHGQDAARVFEKVAGGRAILISTGASDWVDASGEATPVEGGWRVSARKMPASGCPAGDVLVTSIRWDDAPDGPSVIHCSIPFSAEGISIEETWDTMGMRATGSHTVVLEDVFVPEAAVSLIRGANQWHPIWNAVLGSALPLIMSAYVGLAETMAAKVIAMAGSKAEQPHVAPLVGRMLNELAIGQDAVEAMVRRSDNLGFDNTNGHASFVLARKATAAEFLMKMAGTAMEITGGAGFSRRFDIERMFRDIHASQFHPLPEAKQVIFSGRHALGLDPISS